MKRQQFQLKNTTKRQINGFIFLLPFLIGFVMFFAMPLIQTIKYSFNEVGVADQGGMSFKFIGIQNYINLFNTEVTTTSSTILRLLVDENTQILINTPLIVIFSLFLALLANRKFKGRAIVRVIFFLPIVLGIEVIVEMLSVTTGSDLAKVKELYSHLLNENLISGIFLPKSGCRTTIKTRGEM